jgi:hypothetical protein
MSLIISTNLRKKKRQVPAFERTTAKGLTKLVRRVLKVKAMRNVKIILFECSSASRLSTTMCFLSTQSSTPAGTIAEFSAKKGYFGEFLDIPEKFRR